jgi:hypothetical protein
MTMLLIAGIAVLAAGLMAVAMGIPVKEFSFGNTLILAGAIAACTGILLLALAMVVRELRNIARRLGPPNPAAARAKGEPQLSAPSNADHALPIMPPGSNQPNAAAPDPAGEGMAARAPADSSTEPPAPDPAAKPRRNLLFSSSRRERDRTAQDDASDSAAVPAAPKEAAAASFDDAWPQSDRARPDALRRTRSPAPPAEPNAPAIAAERPAAAQAVRSDEPAPVTVLKSGVVDGMAYSLYSDGSIEAQMPEGMMRFASIDELRSHLEQRP